MQLWFARVTRQPSVVWQAMKKRQDTKTVDIEKLYEVLATPAAKMRKPHSNKASMIAWLPLQCLRGEGSESDRAVDCADWQDGVWAVCWQDQAGQGRGADGERLASTSCGRSRERTRDRGREEEEEEEEKGQSNCARVRGLAPAEPERSAYPMEEEEPEEGTSTDRMAGRSGSLRHSPWQSLKVGLCAEP